MRRYVKYIAGATVVAAAAMVVGQVQRGEVIVADEEAPVGMATEAPSLPPPAAALPQPAPNPADLAIDARIAALQAELAARETELATLRATLAERDARLDGLTTTLIEREAEAQALRDELASLRERYAFDRELALLQADAGARPPEKVEAILAAAEAPLPYTAPTILALTQIHFDSGSAALSPGGQVHAAAAAVMLAGMPVIRIRLLGYADRVGSPDRNRVLAEARARAVADFLVRSGVPDGLIETAGLGEDDLPVATDDGVPEPLNRSVAIIAIPRPTS